ncbi:hypothetical protein M413DRAFT_23012 [Hebeloma cylindrosporum]|uniref:Uncharacterized protein n=1 Tax=Hebeloma cylindrosporum TaxID=76867 RepID=A0A0C3CRY1_HEBCY|nr:hypothetical protein M413DRAFT_23012 [Hebeloma cylindrosporum h7]
MNDAVDSEVAKYEGKGWASLKFEQGRYLVTGGNAMADTVDSEASHHAYQQTGANAMTDAVDREASHHASAAIWSMNRY